MASASDFLITPPAQARRTSTAADSATVEGMSKAVSDSQWVTNGTIHKTASEAGNDAQVYRRALAAKLGVEVHKIKSRVWGEKNGTILTDKQKPGDWKFALLLDPNREKRVRSTQTAAA